MIDWAGITRQYGPLVWRTARRLLSNDADAEECFQKTFVSAVHVSRRAEVKNWPGFLQRVATTRALDLLRQRARREKRTSEVDWARVCAPDGDPLALAQDAELVGALRAALARLPALQSEAFCLRHLNGLSYEEIARETGLSVNGVGVAISRAKSRLHELLSPRLAQTR